MANAPGSAAWGRQEAFLSGPSQEPAGCPSPGSQMWPQPRRFQESRALPLSEATSLFSDLLLCSFPSCGVSNLVGSSRPLQALHPKGDQS